MTNATMIADINAVLDANGRSEWSTKVSAFFAAPDAKQQIMLDQLHAGREYLVFSCESGQWDSPIRLPQSIDPIRCSPLSDCTFEMAKAVSLTNEIYNGEKILEIGAGVGLTLMVGASFGMDIDGITTAPNDKAAALLGAVLNDITISLVDDTSGVATYDLILISRAFWSPSLAADNMALARAQKAAGKRVIISSTSLWEGTNEYVSLNPGEGTLIFEIDWMGSVRYIFELV